MTMLYLPDPGQWAKTPLAQTPVTPRDTLNSTALSASNQQLTKVAENEPLRVIYGQVDVGPQVAYVLGFNGGLCILAVWGHGECDSITALKIDDETPLAGVAFTHYLGAPGQAADARMIAAFAQQSPPITYSDALAGVCYSSVFIPPGASNGFPRMVATVKGKKIYDPRVPATQWSDNPALCLADFCASSTYGLGEAVDYTSAASVANDNDVQVGVGITEKSRTLNLMIESVQQSSAWTDTLRTYASCWLIPTASGLKFVSDKAASVTSSFTHTAGNISSLSNLVKRGVQGTPTVLKVTYRDTSTVPHRDGTVEVYAPGVLAGTTKRRESLVSLPGINRYSQAFREATERLNKLLLNDLTFTLGIFDEGLALEVGQVIDVTHPVGLGAKQMRVMGISGEYGDYLLNLVEYDPAVYNATIATAPTFADTNLPSPAAPPAITGVVMTEEVFQLQNGNYASRWRVTWPAAAYSYLSHYRAELYAGAALIYVASPAISQWPTPAVQEGVTYTAYISAVSTIGAVGAAGTQSGAALGNFLRPSNVPSITAFEAGGTVHMSITPAVDIGVLRYEFRYGAVGVAWESTKLIDTVDALRCLSTEIPVGTWTMHVKAIDSVFLYSVTAATVNVTVTSDANAFLINSYDQTAPTLTNMAEYALARDDLNRYFVTEDAVVFATKYSAALSTYISPLASYHNSITSTWLGEGEDFGLLLGGDWLCDATVADISGTHISYFGYSTDGTTYTFVSGLNQKVNARFARLKHEALTTSTLLVTIPTQKIRLNAIPREEVGSGTSSASGAVTITLANSFVFVKKLTITPIGNTARSGMPDNIILGAVSSFDVHIFNDSGARIASPFQYQFQGV